MRNSGVEKSSSFFDLGPNEVLACVEEAGFSPTGEFQQLNSYENRVFDVWLEGIGGSASRIITKFYRPGRWSREAIHEEHQFLQELKSEGVHAIAPLALDGESTTLEFEGMYFSAFPRFSGRMPQEFLDGELKQVGRTLARIHNIGAKYRSEHRPIMTAKDYGDPDLDEVSRWVEPQLWERYEKAAEIILDFLDDEMSAEKFIRIHGDCHKGNLLNNGDEFFFVDFDDFLNGPPVQDFWMLFSALPKKQEQMAEDDQSNEIFQFESEEIISGYQELRDFNAKDLRLIEPLRGLRILHYAAWIGKRWHDPSFPKIFPDFNTFPYWAEETEALEKIAWSL